MPFKRKGVKLYGTSGQSGKFGMDDIPHVHKKEDVDIWAINFDAWTVAQKFKRLGVPYILYPPVDHDPLPRSWNPPFNNAKEIVPYCKFGERVIKEGIAETFEDNVKDYIYHGVDTDVYKPIEIVKNDIFDQEISQKQFVVGIFKNNQGTRPRYDKMFKAFKKFSDMIQGKPKLYVHAFNKGKSAYNLKALASQIGLEGQVMLINQEIYKEGLDDQGMNEMYNACDVLLNTTASEGFGMTILEAMSCGTPAIAGGFSAMPELVSGEEGELHEKIDDIQETERGWVVPISSHEMSLMKQSNRAFYRSKTIADGLYQAYQAFREGRLRQKGENGREFAEQYDWDKIGEKWANYFDGLEERLSKPSKLGKEKRAIIVVGPESSGTRLMTEIMMDLGYEGDAGHNQRWDNNLPREQEKIVWRRSVPHDGKFPDIEDMVKRLRERGYQVNVIVTTRDMKSTYNSQVNAPYLQNSNIQKAFNLTRKAYIHIFSQLGKLNSGYIVSSFDNLIQRPQGHIDWIKEALNFEGEVDVEIEDANAKYYDDYEDQEKEEKAKERLEELGYLDG